MRRLALVLVFALACVPCGSAESLAPTPAVDDVLADGAITPGLDSDALPAATESRDAGPALVLPVSVQGGWCETVAGPLLPARVSGCNYEVEGPGVDRVRLLQSEEEPDSPVAENESIPTAASNETAAPAAPDEPSGPLEAGAPDPPSPVSSPAPLAPASPALRPAPSRPEPSFQAATGPWSRAPLVWAVAVVVAAGWVVKLLASTLFTRLRPSRLLDHPVRARIHEAVNTEPGIHLQRLVEVTSIPRSTVEDHLRRLVAADILHRVPGRGIVSYFTTPPRQEAALVASATKSPAARALLELIGGRPGITSKDAAAALHVHPSSISHHVNNLVRAGLIERARSGRTFELRAVMCR